MSKVFKAVGKAAKSIVAIAAPIAGAAIGSVVPGVGTAVGAAIGGAVGGVASGNGLKGAVIGAGLSYAGASVAGKFLPGATATGNISGGQSFNGFAGQVASSGGQGISGLANYAGSTGITISSAQASSALTSLGSSGLWNTVSPVLGTAGNILKTVTAINSVTGAKAALSVDDPVPQGWTVDASQTPTDLFLPSTATSPLLAQNGNTATVPLTTGGGTSGGSAAPLLVLGGLLLLWLGHKA